MTTNTTDRHSASNESPRPLSVTALCLVWIAALFGMVITAGRPSALLAAPTPLALEGRMTSPEVRGESRSEPRAPLAPLGTVPIGTRSDLADDARFASSPVPDRLSVSGSDPICSGGADGGMDATGNQCNAAGDEVAAAPAAAILAQPSAAIPTPTLDHARSTGSLSAGTPAHGLQIVSLHQSVSRSHGIAKPTTERIQAANFAIEQEVACSGGTNGGMDATGNECNEALSALPPEQR